MQGKRDAWRLFGQQLAAAVVVVLVSTAPAASQVTVGDTSMNLSGSLSAGYSGSYSNFGPSSHGIAFGGTGTLSGSYYNPQFLSFSVSPFYNQSRNNSNFQSITDSSGVTASTTIFGGSRYPGYLNYSYVYNSENNFFLPGIANYKTNGNSQTFGVGWSGSPTDTLGFSVGYQQATNNSFVYGTPNEINSDFHSIFGTMRYSIAGFRLGGGIHHTNGNYLFPQSLAGQLGQTNQVGTTTYNFDLSRSVGWKGTTWLNYSRYTTNYNTLGVKDSATNDIVTGGVSLQPTKKLSTSFGADYNNNLAATLFRPESNLGAIVSPELPAQTSHSWGVYGEAQYEIIKELHFTGDIVHREELFLGKSFGSTAYSGGMGYGRELFGGRFTENTIATKSDLGNAGGALIGLLNNALYTRRIGAWNMNGSFSYSRSIQTLLLGYTTSGFSYSTSAGRRFGRFYWNGTAAGAKSIISEQQGPTTYTQSYSTAVSYGWLGVSGSYSKSSGLGLITSQGITTLPTGLPPSLVPTAVHYGGRTYSIGAGGTPLRGLIFSGTFASTRSNTANGLISSSNHTEEAYTYVQYKFRKVFFTAGYSRLLQGFSASTLAPAMVSTYYVGLSRWFNFF
jgi:hypothetical protein